MKISSHVLPTSPIRSAPPSPPASGQTFKALLAPSPEPAPPQAAQAASFQALGMFGRRLPVSGPSAHSSREGPASIESGATAEAAVASAEAVARRQPAPFNAGAVERTTQAEGEAAPRRPAVVSDARLTAALTEAIEPTSRSRLNQAPDGDPEIGPASGSDRLAARGPLLTGSRPGGVNLALGGEGRALTVVAAGLRLTAEAARELRAKLAAVASEFDLDLADLTLDGEVVPDFNSSLIGASHGDHGR